jgi:hypothetical protein
MTKNFFDIKKCPNCSSNKMVIMQEFGYSANIFEKSQIDDSWVQTKTRRELLDTVSIWCKDCGFTKTLRRKGKLPDAPSTALNKV